MSRTLNMIRDSTGSLCSSRRTGVTGVICSYRLVSVIRRAAVFWILWSFFSCCFLGDHKEAMLNYVRQIFKIRVVFQTLYHWNEVGDPHFFFFSFLTQVCNSLSDCRSRVKFLRSSHQCSHGFATRVHGFATITKARARHRLLRARNPSS